MSRSKEAVLDADFASARASILEVAAFIDRVERGEGKADYRYEAIKKILPLLLTEGSNHARDILETLSYTDEEVPETVKIKAASGAPR